MPGFQYSAPFNGSNRAAPYSAGTSAAAGPLAELPARLIEYLQVSAAGTSQQAMQHSLPARVSLVKGAVLCSRYDWSPHHAILETVGATASFYVAEYFDNVAEYFDNVAVAADERGRLWYA